MIVATKNGIEKKFPESQWNRLPKDKNGWKVLPNELKQEAKNKLVKLKDDTITTVKTSVDYGATEAITLMKEMPLSELDEFIKTDERKSVINALKKLKDVDQK